VTYRLNLHSSVECRLNADLVDRMEKYGKGYGAKAEMVLEAAFM
jgi:uncharacterized protein (DUF4415 family)